MNRKTKWMLGGGFAALLLVTVMVAGAIARRAAGQRQTPASDAATLSPATRVSQTAASIPGAQSETAPAAPETIMTAPTSAPASLSAPQTLPQATTASPATAETTPAPSVTDMTMYHIDTGEFNRIARLLYAFGFVYDAEQNMFYTQNDPWQRNLGYTSFYDDISVFGDMYYDTIRFDFSYGDRIWRYQIWKGRYGATSGCEMGAYYQEANTSNKQFFKTPADDDPLPGMYFELYRYEDFMFQNGPVKHWWLTGFRILESTKSEGLRLKCIFYIPNGEMADALEAAVQAQCAAHENLTYTRVDNDFYMDWAY